MDINSSKTKTKKMDKIKINDQLIIKIKIIPIKNNQGKFQNLLLVQKKKLKIPFKPPSKKLKMKKIM